jgi:hypothetical protein
VPKFLFKTKKFKKGVSKLWSRVKKRKIGGEKETWGGMRKIPIL